MRGRIIDNVGRVISEPTVALHFEVYVVYRTVYAKADTFRRSTLRARCKRRIVAVCRTLDRIADYVVEHRNAVRFRVRVYLLDVGKRTLLTAAERRAAARPAFPVNQRFGVDLVYRFFNRFHRRYVVQAHQVKAETIYVVFLHPVGNGINHILSVHFTIGRRFVAATRAVGRRTVRIITIVIIGYDFIQIRIDRVGMVVNDVHNDGNSVFVERLYHLFKFSYTHLAVVRISRITTFWHVIVFRIVTPVKAAVGIRFIHRCVIVRRQKVYVRNSKLFQIIHANGQARFVL